MMQFKIAIAVVLLCSIVSHAGAQEYTVYDDFKSEDTSLWSIAGKAYAVNDDVLVLKQKKRFLHQPLLSAKSFDLDLASQLHPVELIIKLQEFKGNGSNTKEYNRFEFGWCDADKNKLFTCRYEFLGEKGVQAMRLYNGEKYSGFAHAKSPHRFFTAGDSLGLRITDAYVKVLCNGKVIRTEKRPFQVNGTGACHIYISFMGPANGAEMSFDEIGVSIVD